MASMNLEEQWEELKPTEEVENPMIEDCEEVLEDVKTNDENLKKPTAENIAKESVTATTLFSSRSRTHRKLPVELNREIFLCFNPATQRKFICGLGWDFYAMFRHKLLIKTKRICNPVGNAWKRAKRNAKISPNDGFASLDTPNWPSVFAGKAFPISGQLCRVDNFPGTICYYYEVKSLSEFYCHYWHEMGLSDGAFPDDRPIGEYPNCYSICFAYFNCHLAGERHDFELPQGATRPEWKHYGNVFGCGLLLDPNDKLSIFFTLNGKLKGRPTPISPTVDHLFPTVTKNYFKFSKRSLLGFLHATMETNFGDDPAKPFEYDIKNCPGMELKWI